MIKRYVACDIQGRLSNDEGSFVEVKTWIENKNPSIDCVVWCKEYSGIPCMLANLQSTAIAAVRTNGEWHFFGQCQAEMSVDALKGGKLKL